MTTAAELPAWATAVTVQIPMSPTAAFDHYRRRAFDSFDRCEQKIRDDFTQLLSELDTYLESLPASPAAPIIPARPARRRWRR